MAKIKTKDIVVIGGAGALLSYLLIPAIAEPVDEIAGAGLNIVRETAFPVYNTLKETATLITEYPSSLLEKAKDLIPEIPELKVPEFIGDIGAGLKDISIDISEKVSDITQETGEFLLAAGGGAGAGFLVVGPIGAAVGGALGIGWDLVGGTDFVQEKGGYIVSAVSKYVVTTIGFPMFPTIEKAAKLVSSSVGDVSSIMKTKTQKVSSASRTVLQKAESYAKTMPFMARQIERFKRGEIALGG